MNVCFRSDFRCFRDDLKLSLAFALVFKLVYGFLLRRFVLLPPSSAPLFLEDDEDDEDNKDDEDLVET